jgi:DNA-binding transcriptional MerR regulator
LGIFSIKDIEAVSGIKCHTLRIWEQRYNILTPKRTDTNIRFYDDDDLKLILNISILNKHGHKISEISKMSRDQMNENVIKISGNTNEHNCQINHKHYSNWA